MADRRPPIAITNPITIPILTIITISTFSFFNGPTWDIVYENARVSK